MSELDNAIERGLKKGLDSAFRKVAPELALSAIKSIMSDPAYPIIAGGQLRLMEEGVEPWKAWEMSRECLALLLKHNDCKVGDPGYSWDQAAGRMLVEESEIELWEGRS